MSDKVEGPFAGVHRREKGTGRRDDGTNMSTKSPAT